jgi:outer membrane protein assembly factor BamC
VITPKFDGVRMVTYAGNSWIEVDNSVEHVWPRLLEFWETEGTELAEVRPLLGFMETDWVERLDAGAGFFESMFQKFEPDQKDKFRLRVESFDNNQKTRVYIAHSRIERIVQGEDADEYSWQTRPSDLEAEREIISRMALFAGLNKENTVQLLENYRPYSSLIKMDHTNTTALTMTGSMDFVWRRAMRALDRMVMQDIREDKESSSIHFVVGKVSNEALKVEDNDEIAKSSWMMQLLTGDAEKDPATDKKRQYRLEFSDANGRIQIQVKDARESQSTDEDGDVSGTALAEQLRNILAEKLE